jgi:uncharacterized Fe-S cluster-containing MiaB family protein
MKIMCKTCQRVYMIYKTTEYVAPWLCSCLEILTNREPVNSQSVLQTTSADAVRYRYWLDLIQRGQL